MMMFPRKIQSTVVDSAAISSWMTVSRVIFSLAVAMLLVVSTNACGQTNAGTSSAQTTVPPKTWEDTETGHRVYRVSDEPYSQPLPFTQNAFTYDGADMIYLSREDSKSHHSLTDTIHV